MSISQAVNFGNSFTALHADNSLTSWGTNTGKSVSNTPTTLDFAQAFLSQSVGCGVHLDGSAECWGTATNGGVAAPVAINARHGK